MKKLNKIIMTIVILAMTIFAVSATACTKGNENKEEAKLTAAYTSPAVMRYSNMRPTYNYYLVSFSFEVLETYSDNTYCLIVSFSQFSGIILPEEGNDFVGNERENYMRKYYGTFTAEADELDEDIMNITLSKPTRFVNAHDATMFYDTANWTELMGQKAAEVPSYPGFGDDENEEVVPLTAEEYLAKFAFEEVVVPVNTVNFSFEYFSPVVIPAE